jgi:hypothetical protein
MLITRRSFHSSPNILNKLSLEGLASKANLNGQVLCLYCTLNHIVRHMFPIIIAIFDTPISCFRKNVLLRLDLNVPLAKDGVTITNDKRLTSVLPTLNFLKQQGAKVVIATHLGRPKEPPFPASMKSNIVVPRYEVVS